MATELEARWMESMATLAPRLIESEGVWCVAYDNDFEREIERFATIGEAEQFVIAISQSPQSNLRVKPLEWRRGYCDDQVTISQATSLGGIYQVRVLNGAVWLDKPYLSKEAFPSTEEAIAAAQADHERRILDCLEGSYPAPPQPNVQDIDWFETCLNVVHEHKKTYVVARDDLKQRGKANAAFYANFVEVCDSISQSIHALKAMPAPSPSPEPKVGMLRPAIAAVLAADKHFRATLGKSWPGDPLSDQLDNLRRIFEATPADKVYVSDDNSK